MGLAKDWLAERGVAVSLDDEGNCKVALHSPGYMVRSSPMGDRPLWELEEFLRISLGDWQECLVWNRRTHWYSDEPSRFRQRLRNYLFAGIPLDNRSGAISLRREEDFLLYRVMAATLLCAGALADDMFVVPDSSMPTILSIDHHFGMNLCVGNERKARRVGDALEAAMIEVDMWRQQEDWWL